jgi:hypothetical protein
MPKHESDLGFEPTILHSRAGLAAGSVLVAKFVVSVG